MPSGPLGLWSVQIHVLTLFSECFLNLVLTDTCFSPVDIFFPQAPSYSSLMLLDSRPSLFPRSPQYWVPHQILLSTACCGHWPTSEPLDSFLRRPAPGSLSFSSTHTCHIPDGFKLPVTQLFRNLSSSLLLKSAPPFFFGLSFLLSIK